jgi:RNA polymerase sigma-70 factor (ECF subfamily)
MSRSDGRKTDGTVVVMEPGVDDATALRDPELFAVLYDRYSGQLYRYAYRRVGPELAEDAVAETFLAAFRRRDRYDAGRAGARPWLFGILTRELARWHRTESARYRAFARAGVDDVVPGFADRVDAAVSAQALSRPLAGALARLSRGDRDVLLLVAWGDCSYEEVAETLGIRLGTVRSRLHRARRQIRAALGALNLEVER